MKFTAALLLCLLSSLAGAQPVYRCGNAYSQSPCPAGGRIVDATDARSAAQRAEARRVAADEQRLAVELRRDRLADAKAAKPSGAASLSGPAAASHAAPTGSHPKKKRRSAAKSPAIEEVVVLDPGTVKRRGASR
jgi:type IV secretory pathway TrbL component